MFYEVIYCIQLSNYITLKINSSTCNKVYYYPYRAFGGQNKIVYSTRFQCDKEDNIF